MVAISINVDISGALKHLDDIAKKQLPFATSQTLNQLAFESAKKELPKVAERIFDGGATPWTKRGFKYLKSNKKNLVAVVYIDNDTHKYLTYQVEGGIRTPNAKKILVPTANIKTNKFGNISKAKRDALFNNKSKFFQGNPSRKSGTVGLGVWERYGRKKRKVRMVANYVDRASYTKKLSIRRVVLGVVRSKAQELFAKNLSRALSSAR